MKSEHNIKRGVSFYSYQDEYCFQKLSLEDCIAVSSKMGIEGIEIIGDQMVRQSPTPPDDFFEKWHQWLAKYHVTPVCNDIYSNTTLFYNRVLTKKEATQELIREISFAHKLGCKMLRMNAMTPANIILDCLPFAEKYDVALALEIHAGSNIDKPYTAEFVEIMQKENSPLLGLVPDMGLFCKKFPQIIIDYYTRIGLNPRFADLVQDVYSSGKDVRAYSDGIPDAVMNMNPGAIDVEFLKYASHFENNDLGLLREFMPYIKNIHAKFYEMTEDYIEPSIPYAEIIKLLIDEKYDGYLCSEYEGNRFIPDDEEVQGVEQVRRQQVMMKKYLQL